MQFWRAKKTNMFFHCNHRSTKGRWQPLFLSLGLTGHSLKNSPREVRTAGLSLCLFVCKISAQDRERKWFPNGVYIIPVTIAGKICHLDNVHAFTCSNAKTCHYPQIQVCKVIILSGDIQLMIISSRTMERKTSVKFGNIPRRHNLLVLRVSFLGHENKTSKQASIHIAKFSTWMYVPTM